MPFDEIIHQPLRLRIMSALHALPARQGMEFTRLKKLTGATDGFAIFVSDTTRDIIRLKTGEGHEGWILRSVKAREAVLEKNRRSAVIELPPPTGDRK